MSESTPSDSTPENSSDLAKPIIGGRRSISPIWIIPILVVIVAGTFAYRAIQDRGANIVLLFESAEGLTAGKSKVKYRDVEMGSVDVIRFRTVDQIEVHISVQSGADRYITEDAQWWVVRPRVSGRGLSGLDTILSGGYVTFQPGTEGGKSKREFLGLEEPPIPSKDRPGVQLTLVTDQLGGLDRGVSVFFRDLDVGDVLHHQLSSDGQHVEVSIVIEQAYAKYVTDATRFWNAGGVDISVGPDGLDVKTESIQSIISGGIAFDSPPGGTQAKPNDRFWLHHSRADVAVSERSHGGLSLVLEAGALGGVAVGNPVMYREVPIGAVMAHEFSADGSRVRIRVNIQREYASFVRSNTVFWNASGFTADLGLTGLHVHAESLKSLLAGGVAFATPPDPGHAVKEGSVFQLHPEPKKRWIEWETDFEEQETSSSGKKHLLGKFFHHEEKGEEEAAKDDPTPEPDSDDHKHGLLRRIFHHGD